MITVTVDSQPVADLLAKLRKRMTDLTPVMRSIGQQLETRVAGRFETRTDPLGKSWSPWKPSTVKTYPKDGRRKLLERYGTMLQSLNFKADANSVRVGFGAAASKRGDAYAAFHEFGTKRMARRGLLFADPTLGTLAPKDETKVLDLLGDWLSKP